MADQQKQAKQAQILQQLLDKHRDELFEQIKTNPVAAKIFQGGHFMTSTLNPKNVVRK